MGSKGTGECADVNGIKLCYETHGTGRPHILDEAILVVDPATERSVRELAQRIV